MAQKNETTEASVSSQAAGVKGKGSANALAAKLKTRRLRTAVGAVVFVGMAAGLVAGVSMGTMSGFGWDTFSMLCPLGALGTMIATKTMIPRAVVSLVLIAALVLVFGMLLSASNLGAWGVLYAVTPEIYPTRLRGAAAGAAAAVGRIAAIIAPLLMPWFLTLSGGNKAVAFIIFAAAFIIACVAALCLPERKGLDLED